MGRVSLLVRISVEEGCLEYVDCLLLQLLLLIKFCKQVERFLLVGCEFERTSDRDHKERDDKYAPEANDHANCAAIERLWIQFAVARTR